MTADTTSAAGVAARYSSHSSRATRSGSRAARAGGRVLAESEPGRGSVFTLELPAAEVVAPYPIEATEAARSTRPVEVLLIEPDATLRTLLQRVLERRGHGVTSAARLPPVLPGTLELLVTEWLTPDATGPSLATRLRVRFPGLRVLYLSSVDTGTDAAPGEAVLTKPFTPAALVAALDRLL